LPWLCSNSSRSYPGRPARLATLCKEGKPGFDRVTIEDFPDHFRPLWLGIRQSLLSGSYEPSPVLRTEIPKRSGGKRPLGIPIVLNRVIQQAIAQVNGPIIGPLFSEHSFGFRPGRSAHDAFREFKRRVKEFTPLDAAISVGLSRKGPWKLARTYATQIGMTNQWLKGQGLISVKELWVNIHYPATAR
jgi:hypothetical protein